MDDRRIKIDPRLLTYIYKSLNYYPATLYDFSKITQLNCDGMILPMNFYYENVPHFIEICDGAWEVIGEMKRLKKLTVSTVCLPDFSFLSKCGRLEQLQLISTNFSDYRLLLQLPNLKRLTLENRELLANQKILSELTCQIYGIQREALPEPVSVIEPKEEAAALDSDQEVYARYLHYSIYENGRVYAGEYGAEMQHKITDEILEDVYHRILQGKIYSLLVSDDSCGKSGCCLMAERSEGWVSFIAGRIFDDEPFCYFYHNPRHPEETIYSPAGIGGRLRVQRAFSCDDPEEAAGIILYFIKKGKLSPLWEWYGYDMS